MPDSEPVPESRGDKRTGTATPMVNAGAAGFPPMGAFSPARIGRVRPGRRAGHDPGRDRLTVVGGLAALSLDAMASVAYGPEAIVVVLAAAGSAGLGFTLPVTAAIAGLLGVLVLSYRQVIAAFPDGGGAYAVAKRHLTRRTSLVAAASLVVDYILNVAVSVAAGVAALTSAFTILHPYTVELCLAVLVLVTAINLRGIAHSARAFIVPTIVFVGSILTVIVVGLLRDQPLHVTAPAPEKGAIQAVGALLLLKAFANGCAALTGVEAIANAVPSFRDPAVLRHSVPRWASVRYSASCCWASPYSSNAFTSSRSRASPCSPR